MGARRKGRQALVALAAAAALLGQPSGVRALDTDIFTGTQVPPNVLIIFDNSGSMGYLAYNTYPNTIYSGPFDPGTIYTRCRNKNGISGGNVRADCRCRRVQSQWVVDESSCAGSFVDLIPGPAGDDIDDRESRRVRGNLLNFVVNPPRNCVLSPFQACTSDAECPGAFNSCAVQNKMAIAKGVMTSLINNPENANVRFGLIVFDPAGINYSTLDYTDPAEVGNWQVNDNAFVFPVQDMDAAARASLTSIIQGLQSNGGTPTVHRLIDAWHYFNGEASAPGFTSSPVQETCQRNYFLMVTDGVPEGEADYLTFDQHDCVFSRIQSFTGNPGDANGDGKEDPASPNYLANTGEMFNCGSDYLDDAVIQIRNQFPLGDTENQPVNFYAVSFGFDYCQPPAAGDTSPGGGSLLYRASKKYGGGECIAATQPEQLDDAIRQAINLIKNDAQSFVAPVVPVSQTNRTESGDRLYVALFSPREGDQEWPGNIKKYALDKNHGTICNASTPVCTVGSGSATTADGTIVATGESFWDAATGGPSGAAVTAGGVGAVLLASDISSRHIYTYTGTATGDLGGVDLTAPVQAFGKGNDAITPAVLGLVAPDDTQDERDKLIDYVYGWDSYDQDDDGITNEKRSWILGDIIHSVPLIVNYDSTGTDAAIIVGSNDGMLHAFDDATGAELWAFVPPDVLGNLAQLRPGGAASHPFFVDGSPRMKEVAGKKVVVFGLGRGGRAYYGLDVTAKTAPKLLWRINDSTSGYAELGYAQSTPALTLFNQGGSGTPVAVVGGGYDLFFDDPAADDPNPTGVGRTIFVIDLLTGAKLQQAAASGMTFPIPSDPLVFDVNGDGIFDRGYVGDLGGNLWRIEDDFTVARVFHTPPGQRIFYAPDAVINAGEVVVFFGTGDRTNPLDTSKVDRFYAVADDGSGDFSEANLIDVTNSLVQPDSPERDALLQQIQNAHGWYIRLLGAGEKVLAPPTVFFNVAFTTFIPSTALCDAGGTARIYVLDPLVGGPSFDLAGTSGGGLGSGGSGSGEGGALTLADRFIDVGKSIPTSLKVTFGDDETKAFFGVTKGGGIALQPLNLPQIAANVIPVSWRQVW